MVDAVGRQAGVVSKPRKVADFVDRNAQRAAREAMRYVAQQQTSNIRAFAFAIVHRDGSVHTTHYTGNEYFAVLGALDHLQARIRQGHG